MTSEFDIYNKIQRYLDKNNEVSYGNFEVGGFVAQQSKKGIILDVRKIKNTIKIKVWFTGSEKPEKMQAVVKKQKSNKNFIKLDDTYEVVYEKNGNDFFQIKQKQSISSDDEDFEEEEEEVPVAAPAIVPAPASPISESQRQKELRARENAQADETKIQQADETKIQQADETNSLLNLFEPVFDREENKFIERVYSIKNKDDPFHNEIAMIKNYFLAQPAPVVDEKEEDVSKSARIAVPPAPVAEPVAVDLVSEDEEKEKTKREANLDELPTFVSGEDGNTTDSPSRVEFFYSKSKAQEPSLAGDLNWRQYLSNFQDVPGGLWWDGRVFPNVEHAFHYEKFKRTNKPELGDIYVGEKSQFKSTAKAKVFSGRKSMGNNGATLNVDLWNVERIGVNMALLKARWTQDVHFRSILKDSKARGIKLLHFERGSRKRPPFWGALKLKDTGVIIGENMLSKQMMELRDGWFWGPPKLSNPQDMAAFMNKKVETCGYLRATNDGYYTAVVDGKNITGQGDRAACAWNEPYKKLLWHTHPKGVIAYPSAEDILKVVKPRRDISMIEKSFIYTMWGVWELHATRKAEMSLKDIEKLIRKLDNKYSKKMYNKTEKGRARTLTADMEKYVDAYIQRVETNKKLSKRGFTIILHKNSRDYLLQ